MAILTTTVSSRSRRHDHAPDGLRPVDERHRWPWGTPPILRGRRGNIGEGEFSQLPAVRSARAERLGSPLHVQSAFKREPCALELTGRRFDQGPRRYGLPLTYARGSLAAPSDRTSKWRWGPVDNPVDPSYPMTWP